MIDLREALLPRLESHRIPGLDLGPGTIYPNYRGCSLSNLPASICRWLEAPPLGQPLSDEIVAPLGGPFQHVIFILADGLGLEQLEAALREEGGTGQPGPWREITSGALLAPLTSIAPSTTASALTTLWTGVPPSGHGIMGYEMWVKEYSLILNAITHTPVDFTGDPEMLRRAGFRSETLLPVPTLGPRLARGGVRSFAFHHQAIYNSSLSSMLLPGVESIPFKELDDLWASVVSTLDSVKNERSYSYVYWGNLDSLAHHYGPQNDRTRQALRMFGRSVSGFLRDLRKQQAGRTLLLLTADHGMIFTPNEPVDDLRNHPELLSCLAMLPSGEARLAYLFPRSGQEERLRSYIGATWGEQVRLIPASRVLEAGLFGNGEFYEKVAERIGDCIAIPQGNHAWWWANRENSLIGRHGGLSRAEMLIPLIALPL